MIKHNGWLKSSSIFLLSCLLCAVSYSNPVLNQVVAGKVSISQAGNTTQIKQSGQKAIINWQSFNINAHEKTQFLQPNRQSIILNRVISGSPTQIYGSLIANGQIILVNGAGIYFAPGAYVNVGGLIASTTDISNRNFLRGNYVFDKPSTLGGSITNSGNIIAAEHGLVALLGNNVTNTGLIQAESGSIVLGSGSKFTLDFFGDQLINFSVDAPTNTGGSISNTGMLLADGGRITITADAAQSVLDSTINMQGITQANSVSQQNGVIILSGEGGNTAIEIAGTVQANGQAPGTKGGTVNISANNIHLKNSAVVSASGDVGGGNIYIGGSSHGAGPLPNALTTTIDNGAIINANANTSGNGGNIVVWANNLTQFAGTITAQGGMLNGNGGNVEVSGGTLLFGGGVNLTASHGKTGNLLLDPATLEVVSCGGSCTASQIDPTTVDADLATTNLTLNADTNITITNGISWSSGNVLTLSTNTSGSTININSFINGSQGGLVINTAGASDVISTGTSGTVNVNSFILQNGAWTQVVGQGSLSSAVSLPSFNSAHDFEIQGGTFLRATGGNGTGASPYQLTDIYGIQGMIGFLSSDFILISASNNIDASSTVNWNNGAGFVPIGESSNFTGYLNGNQVNINNLYINASSASTNIGMFANFAGINISKLGLVNLTLKVSSSNNISVGGLVGNLVSGTITKDYVTGTMTVTDNSTSGSPALNVGGLVGSATGGTIQTSYSNINISYGNSGNAQSAVNLGGMLGKGSSSLNIYDSYSLSSVTDIATVIPGQNYFVNIGGFLGNQNSASILNSYSTGLVSSSVLLNVNVGGYVGSATGSGITGSFWDTDTSNQSSGAGTGGASGLTGGCFTGSCVNGGTANLSSASTYSGWSITDQASTTSSQPGSTWFIFDGSQTTNGYTRPLLRAEYSTNITNAHQLQLMGSTLGANYTLKNNIDLTSGMTNAADIWGTNTNANSGAGFVPIGNANYSNAFSGNFNGQYYTINGLYINSQTNQGIGLFSQTSGNITNIGITNVKLPGGYFQTGALVGYQSGGLIQNAYSTGTITNGQNGSSAVGGLVGDQGSGATIDQSYSAVNVSGTVILGGLVGESSGTIQDSYSIGSVTGVNGGWGIGGFDGVINSGTVTNTYSTGLVSVTSSASQYGGFTGYNGGTINSSFWDTDTSNQSTGIGSGTSSGVTGGCFSGSCTNGGSVQLSALSTYSGWSSITDTPSTTSSVPGTTWFVFDNNATTVGYTRPILMMEYSTNITNAHQLQLAGTTLGASYTLANNIDLLSGMTNTADIWGTNKTLSKGNGFVPIGAKGGAGDFTGSFDGQNYTINNLYINGLASAIGLFGVTSNAIISNLGVTNATVIDPGANGGVLVGYMSGGSITNSYATGKLYIAFFDGGGLVGDAFGTITRSYADVDVKGTRTDGNSYSLGGFVGYTSGTILSDNYALGSVTSYADNIGGFVGLNSSTIINSYSTGQVSNIANNATTGSFVGNSDGTITNSFWDAGTAGSQYGSRGYGRNVGTMTLYGGCFGNTTCVSSVSNATNSTPVNLSLLSTYTSNGWSTTNGNADSITSTASTTATAPNYAWFIFDGQTRPLLLMEYSTNIANAHQLQLAGSTLGANYTLANNIDLTSSMTNTADVWGTNSSLSSGAGFVPIGNGNAAFSGNFNGQGYTVNGLYIYSTANNNVGNYNGLFGYAALNNNNEIANVGVTNVNITGGALTGGVIGQLNNGTVWNVYSTGSVTGIGNGNGSGVGFGTGGVIGGLISGVLQNSYSSATVTGYNGNSVGGLVGFQAGNTYINSSYASGLVTGNASGGGFGGLVGYTNGYISNSYSIGNVISYGGSNTVGGFVGFDSGDIIANSYSTGFVKGPGTSIYGFAGGGGAYTDDFWDTTSSGTTVGTSNNAAGVSGLTTSQLMSPSTFTSGSSYITDNGWNISSSVSSSSIQPSSIWFLFNGSTRPMLMMEYSTTITNAHQLELAGTTLGANYTLGNNIDLTSAMQNASDVWGTNENAGVGLGFFPIGSSNVLNLGAPIYTKPFSGTFDGNGYTINGLYINYSSSDQGYYKGLFGAVTGTIQNVGATNVNVTGFDATGGLIGVLYSSGSASKVYSTGSVTGTDNGPPEDGVGGLIGVFYSTGSLNYSYSAANVVGNGGFMRIGGLIGQIFSTPTVSNSYSTGSVTVLNATNDTVIGGFIGGFNSNNSTISNSYSSGLVKIINGSTSTVGGFIGGNITAGGTVTNSFWDVNSSGQSAGYGGSNTLSGSSTLFPGCAAASGTCATVSVTNANNPSNGAAITSTPTAVTPLNLELLSTYTSAGWNISGTPSTTAVAPNNTWFVFDGQTRPLLMMEYSTNIANGHQLQLAGTTLGANYTLENNIDLTSGMTNAADVWATNTNTNTGNGFAQISEFQGTTFNGQGYYINGLYQSFSAGTNPSNYFGLFGQVDANSTVENLGLTNVNFVTYTSHGGGALTAANLGTLVDDYVTGKLVSVYSGNTSGIGGLVSFNAGLISNSYTNVDIAFTDLGENLIGGLASYVTGTVKDSYSIGSITSTAGDSNSSDVGGLIAYSNGATIENSYSTVSIKNVNISQVGALVGGGQGGPTYIGTSFYDSSIYATGCGSNANCSGVVGSTMNGTNSGSLSSYQTYADAGWDISDTPSNSATSPNSTWFIFDGSTRPMLMMEYSTNITNAHQLQLMGSTLGANYSLANNIDLSNGMTNTSDVWGTNNLASVGAGFAPIGSNATPFLGTFNGNYHTISNLYINQPASSYIGLFAANGKEHTGGSSGNPAGNNDAPITDAFIHNLGLVNVSITGYNVVGALIGSQNTYGSVNNVYATGSVTGAGNGGAAIGGLVGYNINLIENVYTNVNVSAPNATWVGGIVGLQNDGYDANHNTYNPITGTYGAAILNSYAIGNVIGGSEVGGIVGQNGGFNSTNYNIASVANTIYSGVVTNGCAAFCDNYGSSTNNYFDITLNPTAYANVGVNGLTTAQMMQSSNYAFSSSILTNNSSTPNSYTWYMVNGSTRPMLVMEEYSNNSPLSISNAHQLQLANVELAGNYSLVSNIDLTNGMTNVSDIWGTNKNSNTGSGFSPIGFGSTFTGSLDGQNYAINNLYINTSSSDFYGLFSNTSGTIKNLYINNANVTASLTAGILSGEITGGIVSNVTINGGSVTETTYVGSHGAGAFGTYINNATVVFSSTSATVNSQSDAGGFSAQSSNANFYYDVSTGNVTGGYTIGGLVGYAGSSNIINSYTTGSVTATHSWSIGGITGNQDGTYIANSYTSSPLFPLSGAVGAISGSAEDGATISNTFWDRDAVGNSYDAVGGGSFSGATGLTTAQAMTPSTFINAGWNVATSSSNSPNSYIWFMIPNGSNSNQGLTRPMLMSEEFSNNTPLPISNGHQLQLINANTSANYALANNIDLTNGMNNVSDIWNTNEATPTGSGFVPLGNPSTAFSGSFDGNSNVINGLYVNSSNNAIGLFGYVDTNGTIENVGLTNVNITAYSDVGGLIGLINNGYVNNTFVTGKVTENGWGYNNGGGGLIGTIGATGAVANSWTDAVLFAVGAAGGLIGVVNNSVYVNNSFSLGDIVLNGGNDSWGGLIGYSNGTNGGTVVKNVYSMSNILGSGTYGGWAGGLFGVMGNGNSVTNAYSTGYVILASGTTGGVLGSSFGGTPSFTNVYWDQNTSGITSSNGFGLPETTSYLQNALPPGFDSNWGIVSGYSYPYLTVFYPSTPRVVSGTVTGYQTNSTSAGYTSNDYIQISVNTNNLVTGSANSLITQGKTSIGKNGYYYFLEGNGIIPDGSTVGVATTVTGLTASTTAPAAGASFTLDFSSPITISGTVPNGTQSNSVVQLVYNGNIIASTTTNSSYDYTFSVASSLLQANSNYLLYFIDGGLTYYGNIETSEPGTITNLTGLNFQNNTLMLTAGSTDAISNTSLATSLGSLSSTSILFNTSANGSGGYNLILGTGTVNNVNFVTSAASGSLPTTNYQMDGSITNSVGTSNITINGPVVLYNSAGSQSTPTAHTISTGNSGVVTINGAVDDAPGLSDSLSINASGGVYINGNIGASNAINALSITTNAGETDSIAANVTTFNSQSYGNKITINNNPTLTSTNGNGITFSGTIDDSSSGANTLSIANNSGAVAFAGSISNNTQIGGLSIGSGDATSLGDNATSINAANNIIFGSTLSLGSQNTSLTTSTGDISFNGNVSWSGSNTLSLASGNNIYINANISGVNGKLTLNAISGGSVFQSITSGNEISTPNTSTSGVGVVGAINVNSFDLQSGNWYQNAAVLPSFSAVNFQLNSGNGPVNATQFLRVTGGSGGNYSIGDIYGLQGVGSNNTTLGYSYTLSQSIDATYASLWNSGAGFVPIGNSASGFRGVFNGQGNTVSNLVINLPSSAYVGLFGQMVSGLIENIGVTNASISGSDRVGALIGNIEGGTVLNTYSTGAVYGGHSVVFGAGGLVGNMNGGTVNSSYSAANVYTSTRGGGLIGQLGQGNVSDSYSMGNVTGTVYESSGYYIGGFTGAAGFGGSASITNSYSTGWISTPTADNTIGGFIGTVASDTTISGSFWDTVTSQQSQGYGSNAGTLNGLKGGCFGLSAACSLQPGSHSTNSGAAVNLASKSTYTNAGWNSATEITSTVSTSSTSPTSTWFIFNGQTRPILMMEYSTNISNAHQLQLMGSTVGANYSLSNNIDLAAAMNNTSDVWGTNTSLGRGQGFVPVGAGTTPFTGNFNGQSHTISNLYENTNSAVGLFGYVGTPDNSQIIENVGLVNINLTTSNGVAGGLIGSVGGTLVFNYGGPTILNTYVTGNIVNNSTGADYQTGGLIGYSGGAYVDQSYSAANILVTTNGARFYVGGLIGFAGDSCAPNNCGNGPNNDIVRDSYSTGNVTATGTGTPSNISEIGGFIGRNQPGGSYIINSYSTGLVTASTNNNYVGGFVGQNAGAIQNSFWDTDTSNQSVGVGRNSGSSSLTGGCFGGSCAQGGSANLSSAATYSTWNISSTGSTNTPNNSTWFIVDGYTRPILISEEFLNNNPLPITNAHQLQLIDADLSASYVLGSAVDLSSGMKNRADIWGTNKDTARGSGFSPIGMLGNFTGTINGENFAVNNLYINLPTSINLGLFSQTGSSASISNIGVANVSITGGGTPGNNGNLGALVGFNTGTITNAYSSGTITEAQSGTIYNLGGLVGDNWGSILQSYSSASLVGASGTSSIGGLAGASENNALISNSYAIGSVSAGANASSIGGLVGYFVNSAITNSYSSTVITVGANSTNVGGFVGMDGAPTTISNSFWDTSTSGISSTTQGCGSVSGCSGLTGMNTANMMTLANFNSATSANGNSNPGWSITSTSSITPNNAIWFIANNGTRPILISEEFNNNMPVSIQNTHQLQLMDADLSASYNLANKLDLTQGLTNTADIWGTNFNASTGSGFVPIGSTTTPFTGNFNGNNNTINALYINLSINNGAVANTVGLFGDINGSNSIIENVGVTNANVTGENTASYEAYVGILVAKQDNGIIYNDYSTGSATMHQSLIDQAVGGLVGLVNDGFIGDSYSTALVTETYENNAGGFVGIVRGGVITSSFSTGNVFGRCCSGGFTGGISGNAVISNSYSTGNVVNSSNLAGGFVGYLFDSPMIINSYSLGSVTGSGTLGGFIGANFGTGTIINSFWDTGTSGISYAIDSGSIAGVSGSTFNGAASGSLAAYNTFNNVGWSIGAASGAGGVWQIIDGYSYPFLAAFYSSTPAVISGYAPGAASGVSVSLAAGSSSVSALTTDGLTQGSVTSYKNGFYYFLEPNQVVANGSTILTSTSNANAIDLYPSTGGILGLNLTANQVTVGDTVNTESLSNDIVAKAYLSGTSLYTVSGNNITISSGSFATAVNPNESFSITGSISASGAITFANTPVTLGVDTILTGAGIGFGSSITGSNYSLTLLDSGISTFSGAVSGLTTLTTNAINLNSASGVSTSGAQSYGAVTLGASQTLVSTGANGITFNSTIDGAYALSLANNSGAILFGNKVGNGTALSSLTIGTGNATAINTTTMNTTAGQTYNSAVTLGANAVFTGVGINFASSIAGASNSLTLTDSSASTFGGALSGLSSVTTNVINLNGGAITTTGAQSYGAVTLGANTTLTSTLNGSIALNSTVTGNGHALQINTAGAASIVGIYSDGTASSSLTFAGAGTLTLSGANTYTGATNINSGTLQLSGSGVVPISSALTLANGTQFNLADISDSIGSLNGSGNINTGILSTTVLTLGGDNTSTTYAGQISGAGGVTKVGSGNFTLSNSNFYTGNTTINAGILTQGTANAIPAASNLIIASNASLGIGYDETLSGLSGNGNINISNNVTLTINNSSNSVYSGSLTGSGNFTKQGVGTLLMSGANNYNGTTSIQNGILAISTTSSLGAVNVSSGAELMINGTTLTTTSLAVNGTVIGIGTAVLNGNMTLGASTTIGTQSLSDTLRVNGNIDGANALTLSGPGSIAMSGVIGGTTALTTISSSANTTLAGGVVNTTGGQTYTGLINITQDTTLTSSSGAISVNSVDGANALVMNSANNASVTGAIGSNTPLASLTVNSSNTTINSSLVATTGLQTYNSPVTFTNSTSTVTASNITFAQGVSGSTVNLNGATGNNNFNINGNVAVTNLNVTGSANGNNTLQLNNPAVAQNWSITGSNTGGATTSGSNISFNNISNLVGGAGNNTFTLSGGSLSGSITGGSGNNTLIGSNGANTWNISGINSGSVNGVGGGYSQIQNITGGTGGNTFIFASNSSITGLLNGGSNVNGIWNTIDYTNYTGSVVMNVTGPESGSTQNVSSFTNINNIKSNGSGIINVNGTTGANTVTITGAGAGYVNDPIYFTGFYNYNTTVGGTIQFTVPVQYDTATNTYSIGSVPITFSNFTSINFAAGLIQPQTTITSAVLAQLNNVIVSATIFPVMSNGSYMMSSSSTLIQSTNGSSSSSGDSSDNSSGSTLIAGSATEAQMLSTQYTSSSVGSNINEINNNQEMIDQKALQQNVNTNCS